MNIGRPDGVRIIVILVVIFILFQGMPVHFFADNTEYVYLGKYYSTNFLKIFSAAPLPENKGYSFSHLVLYRPVPRLFFTISYIFSGLDPLAYNILQGIFFLILVISIYNITVLLTEGKLPAFLAVLFFLATPANYKLIHWLGSTTLLNSSLVFISEYFLFSAIKSNSYARLYTGLILALFALLTKITAVFTIPIMLSLFFCIFRKDYAQRKKIFYIAIFVTLLASILVFILNLIAFGFRHSPELQLVNVFCNIKRYYSIFYENSTALLFFTTLFLFLLKPHKSTFLFLLYGILFIFLCLPWQITSSKYYTQASIGFSMFVGSVLGFELKEKPGGWHWFLVALILIGFIGSAPTIPKNIKKIMHTFYLAKISYAHQSRDMVRLSYLPKNSTIYVDDDAPKIFYKWLLLAMDRGDVKIVVVKSKDKIQPEFFFYGETTYDKTHSFITDRLGDWRF